MSYILDALKKSEQERGHGDIPDVQTIHSSSLNYRSDKKVYWPYILIAAVILNLFAIAYFIFDKEQDSQTLPAVENASLAPATSDSSSEEKVEQLVTETAPIMTRQDIETAEPAPDKTVMIEEKASLPKSPPAKHDAWTPDTTNHAQPAKTNNVASIIDYHELPESTRQQIPAIIISAHVYSSNPQQRSIVINNNFMEEGEYVLDGLILYEITTGGAVFNYQGTLFSYDVVSGWQ